MIDFELLADIPHLDYKIEFLFENERKDFLFANLRRLNYDNGPESVYGKWNLGETGPL